MNRYLVIIFVAVFSNGIYAIDDITDAKQKVRELNKVSFEKLGISLNALSYLLKASKSGYILMSSVKCNGDINFINELEAAGYAKLHVNSGLPDETELNDSFLNIEPTALGLAIIAELKSDTIKTVKSDSDLKKEIDRLLVKVDTQLEKHDQDLKNLEAEEFGRKDVNKDGIQDLFYEEYDNYYLFLEDRNFDGTIDSKWTYSLKDVLLSGVSDNDFDGIFETKYVAKDGVIVREFIDSDGNGLYDIFSKYEYGVWLYSEKYYPATQDHPKQRIGRTNVNFREIKSAVQIESSDLTEIEFQEQRLVNAH